MCLFTCECTCHDLHRKVSGQLVEADCLFWLCGSQESSSGMQADRQVPMSVEPSRHPYWLTLLSISVIFGTFLGLFWLNKQSKHIHHPFTALRRHWVLLKYRTTFTVQLQSSSSLQTEDPLCEETSLHPSSLHSCPVSCTHNSVLCTYGRVYVYISHK